MFPLPGQIISKSTLTALKPSAEQQKQLDDLQKEVDAKLDTLLERRPEEAVEGDAGELRPRRTVRRPSGRPRRTTAERPGRTASRKARAARPADPAARSRGIPSSAPMRYGPDFPGLAGKVLKPGKTIRRDGSGSKKKANEAKKSQETAKK